MEAAGGRGGSEIVTADDGPLDAALAAALYVEHGDELRRFLIGVLRDPELAADALQSTLVKLLEKGKQSREETRKAWLFRVAFHEALALRRRNATGDKALRQVAWSRSTVSAGSTDPTLRLETVDTVRQALAELSPEQLAVVRRRIFEEKTFAEIARELQIPLGTALDRMHSALAKLRKRLNQQESP
jgi:RNA polymerase sigma factor (sigma-70 family)